MACHGLTGWVKGSSGREEFNLNASQVGPSSTDAPQQVKIIEDLIARKVDAITIVPNDANVLEPVFKSP